MSETKSASLFSLTVIAAALGYFVDIYDLLIFGIIRIPSLKDLGLDAEMITLKGEAILWWQMIGLLLGGFLWGVLGDKLGRVRVLFGSILLYSIANIANGFVHSVEQYKIIRFFAGIGLAGGTGAGLRQRLPAATCRNSQRWRGRPADEAGGIHLQGAQGRSGNAGAGAEQPARLPRKGSDLARGAAGVPRQADRACPEGTGQRVFAGAARACRRPPGAFPRTRAGADTERAACRRNQPAAQPAGTGPSWPERRRPPRD